MAPEVIIQRCRSLYAKLLRLYPKPHYQRFAESMEQTFNDRLLETVRQQKSVIGTALSMFIDTGLELARQNGKSIMRTNRNILRIAIVTALILLVPLLSMLITGETGWGPGDYVLAGSLLFGTGLAWELISRRTRSLAYKAAITIALVAAFVLVFANLAVGIVGSEDNPVNLMYFGVLAVGLIGAILVRLEAQGMARALFATAFAHTVVAVCALIIESRSSGSGLGEIVMLNACFVALFVGSALLFRRAGAAAPRTATSL
ncbi:MAG TPA: hypothetical protein VER03_04945 [Bryobacteraceae bacterium]|nr:hypothetical protein [Bryobacteraceae bacterium]